ncbi:hypothetical protein HPB48_018590 [Haemaphysalis longicornis]|uniref:CCHC-type domain-containing protein n=1 Tax=Haemaphysalis longicornis TaxID=44386 RepID=A0A9J6GR34_HAELO|nr:hypothetical protein HPB48_018590 [Haemaphysalis longicornis]
MQPWTPTIPGMPSAAAATTLPSPEQVRRPPVPWPPKTSRGDDGRPRCQYCQRLGHVDRQCRQRYRDEEQQRGRRDRPAHFLIDFPKKTLQIEARCIRAPGRVGRGGAQRRPHRAVQRSGPNRTPDLDGYRGENPQKRTRPRRTKYHTEEWTAGGLDFDKCGVWGWISSRGQSYKITGDCAS